MEKQDKKPLIQVLERAFDVLELLARENRALRATDIAEHLELSLNTAHNLIRTLYNRGYLAQEANRLYSLGPQCFYLGSFADRWGRLREAALPVIRELSGQTGELSFVGVIENRKLFCVALTEGEDDVTVSPRQRWAEELHDTASGRLLLAFLPETEQRRIIDKYAAKTDPAALADECHAIRDRQYAAIFNGPPRPMTALAVPIRNREGQVIAALGQTCSGAAVDIPAHAEVLNRFAARIAARLRSGK